VLLRHERASTSLGEFLVEQGVISPAVLTEALDLQRTLQPSMTALLARGPIKGVPNHILLEAVAA
jgi:hypothetical protein